MNKIILTNSERRVEKRLDAEVLGTLKSSIGEQNIQRKPVALDSLSFAAIISPTNGRNIMSLKTT